MKLNKELLTKAKAAKTAEEIMALAKENGMELTEESCKDDGAQCDIYDILVRCNTCGVAAYCHSCQYCTYEKGLWLCNNPVNMK